MPATNHDLTIEQGTDWNRVLELKNSDNSIMNLTGYTARLDIRTFITNEEYIIRLTTANSKIVITPLLGKIELKLTNVETAAFEFETAVYDLELVDVSSKVIRLLKGKIFVDREVTRI